SRLTKSKLGGRVAFDRSQSAEDGSGRFKKTQDAAELALPILGFYGLKLFPNLLLGQPPFMSYASK
ncbi:hypothetical protein, partial [Paenibacillus sp. GCM10023250]|uniref:hypothetical protein n=1 Tax=Paenibacillus sp. GCM10023250 TaxID=3252648 RepID=UPI003617ADD7